MSVPLVDYTHCFSQHDFGKYGITVHVQEFDCLFIITVYIVLEGLVVKYNGRRGVEKVLQ